MEPQDSINFLSEELSSERSVSGIEGPAALIYKEVNNYKEPQ